MIAIQSLLVLIARLCLGVLFLWAAVEKLMDWDATLEYMSSKQLPNHSLLLPLVVGVQVIGALSLIFGYRVKWGALLLILFIVPTSFLFHDFWNLRGSAYTMEQIMFMKNLGIFGGLLLLIAYGSGKYSISSY